MNGDELELLELELEFCASWLIDCSWFDELELELELELESEPDAVLDDPAETVSPLAPDTEAIVPVAGARSLVEARAASALSTLS
jgi:hypothetical protein